MPKEDTDFQFEGTPVSYVAKPFVMTMNDGALLVPKADTETEAAGAQEASRALKIRCQVSGLRKT